MLAAVRVLVIVTGAAGSDGAAALESALRGALGPDAVVTVEREAVPESDAALLDRAASTNTALVGVVSETDEQHATIRFARKNEGWSRREIQFDPTDAPRERGRTIGFALASVVPEEAPPPPPPPPLQERPRPARVRVERVELESTAYPTSRAPWIDLVGLVGTAVDGFGGGGGGALAGRFTVAGDVRVRFALGARGSDVPPAQASAHTYFGSAGLAWQPWVDAERHYGLGARVDALLLGTEVSHFDADDAAPARKFRVLPGASAFLEATLRFTPSAAFVAAAGTEIAFGQTDLYLHQSLVATIAPVRVMGEVGLRVFF